MKQNCPTPILGQEVCDWIRVSNTHSDYVPEKWPTRILKRVHFVIIFVFYLRAIVRLPVFYFRFLMKRRNKEMTFTKEQSSVGQCTKRVPCKTTQTARAQMLSPYSKEQRKTTMTSCANASFTELLLHPTDERRGPCRIFEVHGCLPSWEVREDRADFLRNNLV